MITRIVLKTHNTLKACSTIAFVIFCFSIIIRELILIVICSSISDSSKCNATIDSYFMEYLKICPSGNTYPIPILQSTTIQLCNPLPHFMHPCSSLSGLFITPKQSNTILYHNYTPLFYPILTTFKIH